MDKQTLIAELGISDRTWRRWCSGLEIPSNQSSYSDLEASQLHELRQQLANKVGLEDAIATITGRRPEPKQAPGRYSNLPAQLQPKAVAGALVQQFDQDVMTEFFRLLGQPLTRQEINQYVEVVSGSDDVIDAFILEAGSDD